MPSLPEHLNKMFDDIGDQLFRQGETELCAEMLMLKQKVTRHLAELEAEIREYEGE